MSPQLDQLQHELTAVIDQAIAGRLIRYTLIIAVPEEGTNGLIGTTCGNATAQLTLMMVTDALMKIRLLPELRRDVTP